MKAVLYARVSSREQQDGHSLEAQVKLCKAYAERNRIEVVKEFVVAESAKVGGRERFEEMVSFVKKDPGVIAIICEKADRLHRGDLKDRVTVDDLQGGYGKEIHLVKDGVVLDKNSKSQHKLIYGIQAEVSRFYLNNMADEVKKSYDIAVEEGKYPHPPPIGYRLKLENHIATIDQDRVLFIIRCFELASSGSYTERKIAEILFTEGFRSRSGRRVGKSQVGAILHNPFYYGDFNWGGKIRKGVHPPLISKELFDRVQVALSPKGKNKGRKHNFAYAGGLMVCGHCGFGVTAEIKKGHVYYHCTKPRGASMCPGLCLREENLEEQLVGVIRAISLSKDVVELIKSILKNSHTEEEKYHVRSLEALQGRYSVVKENLDRLLDLRIGGEINKDIYETKAEELGRERDDIDREINKHKTADKAYFQQVENFIEVAYRAPELFAGSSPELKRELLKFVVSNLSLNGREVVPTYRLPFNLLVEYAQNENWQGCPDSDGKERFWRAP